MEIGLVRKIDINQEMQQSYLDYAMSVIVSRALPDARDGLKPVHRRILYAMYDMGLRPNTSYKKSARVVGEVLGKYHPHSDQAVYDAMARMVQTFSMRLPLVDGQGNFGSVDGDSPAAMRYTEAKLASPAMDIMTDIQKGTVEFIDNFDGSLQEPTVLPAALPNMLVNGATGIAVGMATSIPPHNLGEVVNALIYMLENWKKVDKISVEDLMQFIKGPDFPTGGIILGGLREDGLAAAYGTGRGRITVQARVHIEEMGRGRKRIIITELPYMTNKASLIERIAKLVRAGTIDGISDLRDESDRQGMRVVIEISKNADGETVLEALYKRTPMRTTFSIGMLALVDNQPRLLSLKQALQVYIEHRMEVIKRRSEHDLERARQRAHLLEGLRVALKNLDAVINLIRKAPDVETARTKLMKRFKLSEIQANAILDMPLRRLAALERKKIEIEYKELQKQIKALEGLLKSAAKMRKMVSEELQAVQENYGDRRRTQIIMVEEGTKITDLLTAHDIVADATTYVQISPKGLVSRTQEGKTVRMWGSSAPGWVVKCNTRDTLYLVSESGETAAIAVHAVPEAELSDQGEAYFQLTPLSEQQKLSTAFSLPPQSELGDSSFVLTVSTGGMVKKSASAELPGPSAQTFVLAKAKPGDKIGWAYLTNGSNEILLATANGQAIRFKEEEVRPMGLVATGVNGIKLKDDDQVIGATVPQEKFEVFLLTSDGQAKRIKLAQFPIQGRYGQGVAAWKLDDDTKLVGLAHDKPNQEIGIHLGQLAAKKTRLDAAPMRTRPAKGKTVIEVRKGDKIASLAIPWEVPDWASKTATKPKPPAAPPKAKAQQMQMSLGDGKASTKKKAATRDVLDVLLETCDESVIGIRDQALLLFAFSSGGRRRSEVALARVEDLTSSADGFVYRLPYNKTDQEGEGASFPVLGRAAIALRKWLQKARIKEGPIFRGVSRHGRILAPVSDRLIARVVQKRASLTGLDPREFAGHSLWSGFMTEGGRQGHGLGDLMALSGHRSTRVALGYHQAGAAANNPAARLAD